MANELRSVKMLQDRWMVLETLYNERMAMPLTSGDGVGTVRETLLAALVNESREDMRNLLDYLKERKLIEIEEHGEVWLARIKRTGIDLVEHTIDCEPGINRPTETLAQAQRRERIAQARWYLLYAAGQTRRVPLSEKLARLIMKDSEFGLSDDELRREMDYLRARDLVRIEEKYQVWHMKLTRQGMDLVDGVTECWPGIDRPQRG